YLNEAFGGVADDLADLILCIVVCMGQRVRVIADATHKRKFRKRLDLDPPPGHIRKVPVEAVEFVQRHPVEYHLHCVDAEEVPRLFEHMSAPGELRGIFDLPAGDGLAARFVKRRKPDQLQERHRAVERTLRGRRVYLNPRWTNTEAVGILRQAD